MASLRVYVASRASVPERPAMWRRYRDKGAAITSTWIDEAGEGETENFSELWQRIGKEIEDAHVLVLYAELEDLPLKGALVEVGIAIGMGKPVMACLPGVALEARTMRPIGSWLSHPLVSLHSNISAVMAEIIAGAPMPDPKDMSNGPADGAYRGCAGRNAHAR